MAGGNKVQINLLTNLLQRRNRVLQRLVCSCQDESGADEDDSSGDEDQLPQGGQEEEAAPSVPSLLLVTQKVGSLPADAIYVRVFGKPRTKP